METTHEPWTITSLNVEVAYTAWKAQYPTCPPHDPHLGTVPMVGCAGCEWENGAWLRRSHRVLVCGSRDWKDAASIRREIQKLAPDVVIHGGASGADSIGADR